MKTNKKAILIFFLMTAFFAFNSGAWSHVPNNKIVIPGAGSRILFILPHFDDELISGLNLAYAAKRNGADIKFLYITASDGQINAARLYYKSIFPTTAEMIDMGRIRMQETLKALAYLGFKPSTMTVLGFPDGAIEDLYYHHMQNGSPYFSKNSMTDRIYLTDSPSFGQVYSGENLIGSLYAQISDYSPTLIIYPHPSDDHPDHRATYDFVKLALRGLHEIQDPDEWLYLVHNGFWPVIGSSDPGGKLQPPFSAFSHQDAWFGFTYAEHDFKQKSIVRSFYISQAGNSILIDSLIRTNELFYDDSRKSKR